MKYFTIQLPGDLPALIAFSPHLTHETVAGALLRAFPRAEVKGAGFLAMPEEMPPRCVGESTSLRLGPTPLDQTCVDIAVRTTARTYPYQPLLDPLTPTAG